jgi:hypothetical protein
VSSQANAAGAKISTADLYSFVLGKCGGSGYAHCDGTYYISFFGAASQSHTYRLRIAY